MRKKKPVKDEVYALPNPSMSPPPGGGECSHQSLKRQRITTTPTVTSSLTSTMTPDQIEQKLVTVKILMEPGSDGWISVNSRLPSAYGDVLVNCISKYGGNTFVTIASWNNSKVTPIWLDSARGEVYVTHWMPFPKPIPMRYKQFLSEEEDNNTFYVITTEQIYPEGYITDTPTPPYLTVTPS